MKKPFELSFDGCGFNLVSEEFAPRFATIQSNFRNAENAADTRELARMMEAAPELLAALINLRGEVLRRRGESLRYPHADLLLEDAAKAIEKALGKA